MSKNIAKLNINNVDFTFKDAELRNTVSGLINEINNSNKVIATSLNDLDSRIPDISGKVDKIEGKGLSTEDYTTEEKTKLAGIAAGAEVNVQSDWEESDSTSDAYIANKPFESVNESHFYVDDNGQLGINDAIIGIDYNNWEDTGDSTVILSSGDNTAFEAVIPIAGRQLPVPGLITPEDYKKLDDIQPDYSKQYLTFVAKENGTFTFTPQNNNVISYSIDDGSTWTEGNEVTVNNGGRVLWKGSMTPNTSGIGAFSSTANFDVQGNIMSLLYGDDFIGQTDLTGKNYCFYQLFMQNTKVVNAKNLILPATTLASYCYQRMFRGCTSLTTAPVLPATTLASYCYQYMFQNCTSLTTAPSILPATTLANSCYYYMFNSCTSLTTAPELPATTLANSCYYYMFNDCTSLTTAPVLPATTLVSSCYNGMFYGCTSLTTAPVLPATTLASQCYCSMFYGCTSLTTAPELPTTTLASQCYRSMFSNCTSLTTAPVLSATTLASSCYSEMFKGCSSLNYIKAMFTTTPSSSYTYDWISGVSSTGTFIKNSEATWDVTGNNGIPTGWNVYTDAQWKEVKHYELDAELDALEDSLDDVHETIASALNDLDSRIEDINEVGAQANVIEAIKVNDELLPITDKTVNIYDKIYIKISGNAVPENEEPDEGRAIISNFVDNNITPEYFQNLATKYDLNQSMAFHANNSNVIFEYNDYDLGVFNYVYDKGFSSYLITDENESVGDFKTLALFLSTKNNIVDLVNNSKEYACCVIRWDNENSKWKFQWLENKKAIIPGNYNGFSEIYTTTTISAYDSDGSNNNAKIVLTGKESNDNAQINITTETNDGLKWNDKTVATVEDFNKYDIQPDYSKQYLTFECLSAGTITITANYASVSKTISYSIDDGSTWTNLTTSTTAQSLGTFAIGDKILIKGTNNSYGTSSYRNQFGGTAQVKVYGNIMSLIYGENFVGQTSFPLGSSYNFYYLFYQYTNLINVSNLILPALTLSNYCYSYMFYGCTSLTKAPELPALTLSNYCYASMFSGCTSLTKAPELPATTLASNCYNSMFSSCRALTTAPELPATTLADSCYASMFYVCTKLTQAPELSATTLIIGCYASMFYGCTKLTKTPELPATTLVQNCYNSMFKNCTSLNEITCLATYISAYGCTYDWVANVAATGIFIKNTYMSSWTTGNNGIPNDWNVYIKSEWKEVKHYELDALNRNITTSVSTNNIEQILGNSVYDILIPIDTSKNANNNDEISNNEIISYVSNDESYLTFNGTYLNNRIITKANIIGNGIYDSPTIVKNNTGISYENEYMTFECLSAGTLTVHTGYYVPSSYLLYKKVNDGNWESITLTANTTITIGTYAIDDKISIKGNITSQNMYSHITFGGTAQTNVYGNIMSLMYGDNFIGQTELTSSNSYVFYGLFGNDGATSTAYTNLISAENLILPATTLASDCYQFMFNGCTSLTKAPELPATTLASYCYSNMFSGCTSLNEITCLATDISANECTYYWVNNMSATGTFITADNPPAWTIGVHGIPSGWTTETISENKTTEYHIYPMVPIDVYGSKMRYLHLQYC